MWLDEEEEEEEEEGREGIVPELDAVGGSGMEMELRSIETRGFEDNSKESMLLLVSKVILDASS